MFFQLLYLVVSVVPLMVMYLCYKLIISLPGLMQIYTTKQNAFWLNLFKNNLDILILMLGCFIVCGAFYFAITQKSKTLQIENFNYDNVTNLNNEALNFFLAFALGLISADRFNIAWVVTLFIFLTFLIWRVQDYRVNLLLWYTGMKQYAVSNSDGLEHTLIAKSKIKNKSGKIKVIRLDRNLLLEV